MANEAPAAIVFDNELREQAAQNTLAASLPPFAAQRQAVG
jgi:hypothetical protein